MISRYNPDWRFLKQWGPVPSATQYSKLEGDPIFNVPTEGLEASWIDKVLSVDWLSKARFELLSWVVVQTDTLTPASTTPSSIFERKIFPVTVSSAWGRISIIWQPGGGGKLSA